MDAGVKLRKPVSGIAMGLISDSQSGKWAVLSDILGDEDHLGDMDFKVTGTKDGITATQMDIKVDGLSYEVLALSLIHISISALTVSSFMYSAMYEAKLSPRTFLMASVTVAVSEDTELATAVRIWLI